MQSKKKLFVPAAFVFAAFISVSTASAQDSACPYTLASLQGTYAVVLTYGANIAAGFQIEKLDGKGNVTRTGPINQPVVGSETGQRSIAPTTSVGTYTVNCDGTGVITRVVTQTSGTSTPTVDDFMITAAERRPGYGVMMATKIHDMQRTPSSVVPGGIFVTRIHSRLPDSQ